MNNLPTVYVSYDGEGKIETAQVWPVNGGRSLKPTKRLQSCDAAATLPGLRPGPHGLTGSLDDCQETWLIDGVHGRWSTEQETQYLDAFAVATQVDAYRKTGGSNLLSMMIKIAESLAAKA